MSVACLALLAAGLLLAGISGAYGQSVSVSFDKDVYPVPLNDPYNNDGQMIVPIMINDPGINQRDGRYDYIKSNVGDSTHGPLKVFVSRGSDTIILGTAGAPSQRGSILTVGAVPGENQFEYGPIGETDDGIFQHWSYVRHTDGPQSSMCPVTHEYKLPGSSSTGDSSARFADADGVTPEGNFCILVGDTIIAEYTYLDDAGNTAIVRDSSTFGFNDAVLRTDKETYDIGDSMVLTLTDPDLDADTYRNIYSMDDVTWDTGAVSITMGREGGALETFRVLKFLVLHETGSRTGVFEATARIPSEFDGNLLNQGDTVTLSYVDSSPSGASYAGQANKTVSTTILISESKRDVVIDLDKETYNWIDRVRVSATAHDFNTDGGVVEEIGNGAQNSIRIATRADSIDNYKLVETGPDTGIFAGEVVLTGFPYDADGDREPDIANPASSPDGSGPTDGLLKSEGNDDVTVTFTHSDNETFTASSPIRWDLGYVEWPEPEYAATESATIRITELDLNLDLDSADSFEVEIRSIADRRGLDLTVTETGASTGIFEGVVTFTLDSKSDGNRLLVVHGDTVTATYRDRTLPALFDSSGDLTFDPDFTDYLTLTDTAVISKVAYAEEESTPVVSVELDRKTYSWTDRVRISITSPDHNLDGDSVDAIGGPAHPVMVKTGIGEIDTYRLVETGKDTGVFAGELVLAGFAHDAGGKANTGNKVAFRAAGGNGPDGGFLPAKNHDTITVSFEYATGSVESDSSSIRWNRGQLNWLDANYTVEGTGMLQIIDLDMNLDPDSIDSFGADVQSDSDPGGIRVTVTETGKATGIFESNVFFTAKDDSADHRLYVTAGDTVSGEYDDNTLPGQHTPADSMIITADVSIEMSAADPILTIPSGDSATPTDKSVASATKPTDGTKPADAETAGDKPADAETAGDKPVDAETTGDKPVDAETTGDTKPKVNTKPVDNIEPPDNPMLTVNPKPVIDPDPASCGSGTELVDGVCQVVPAQNGFDLFGWLFSWFR